MISDETWASIMRRGQSDEDIAALVSELNMTRHQRDAARVERDELDGPGIRFASIIVMRQGGEKIEDAVTSIAAALYWSRFRARLVKRDVVAKGGG